MQHCRMSEVISETKELPCDIEVLYTTIHLVMLALSHKTTSNKSDSGTQTRFQPKLGYLYMLFILELTRTISGSGVQIGS